MVKNSMIKNKTKMILLLFLGLINAQNVPMLINYQAKLVDNNDAPIEGTVEVTFIFYDALENGNLIWNETYSSIVSNSGIISVLLGSVTPLKSTHFINDKLYIETDITNYGILSPRQQITSTPFAIKAENTYKLFIVNYLKSFQGASNSAQFTLLDTTIESGSFNEFIRVEISEPLGSYQEGFKCRVSAGINGETLDNYGDLIISNAPYYRNSPGDMFFNHNPQAFWIIPITTNLVGKEIQIQIKVSDSNLYSNQYPKGNPKISVWGK